MTPIYVCVMGASDPESRKLLRTAGPIGRIIHVSHDVAHGYMPLLLIEFRSGEREVFRPSDVAGVRVCGCGCEQPLGDAHRWRHPAQRFLHGHNQQKRPYPKSLPSQEPNPDGLCQCGCGNSTGRATQGDVRAGLRRGWRKRFLKGHNLRLRANRGPVCSRLGVFQAFCRRGHPMQGANVYTYKRGSQIRRECLRCRRARQVRALARRTQKQEGTHG